MVLSQTHRPKTAPDSQTCVFCREARQPPFHVEHIIPRALLCPAELVLSAGEVCPACNARLSRVDAKLVEALRPHTPFLGHRTKKGKWPRAHLDNGLIERTGEAALNVVLSYEAEDGLSVEVEGPRDAPTAMKINFTLRLDERVARGLHKVALELIARFKGPSEALKPHYDPSRSYAMCTDNEFRPILVVRDSDDEGKVRHGRISILHHSVHGAFVLIWLFNTCFGVALEGKRHTAREIGKILNAQAGESLCVWFDRQGISREP